MCSHGDLLCEGLVLLAHLLVLLLHGTHVATYLLVFGHEGIVDLVERIDLGDIIAEDAAHRLEFLLEGSNTTGILGLGLTQLLDEALDLDALVLELLFERVVVDLQLVAFVLDGELGVFVFELFLFKCKALGEFVDGLLLTPDVVATTGQQGKQDDGSGNDNNLILHNCFLMFSYLWGVLRHAKGTNAVQRYAFFVKYGPIDANFFKY